MTEPSRVRNLAVLIILAVAFAVPAIFIPQERMLDIVSGLMFLFGVLGFYFIANASWEAFWSGRRDRASVALYGLSALFLSIMAMRSYGILTRNVESIDAMLSPTHTYAVFVYLQFIGLYLFTRASEAPTVPARPTRWGQLFVGVIIGALIASSKMLEPALMFIGKCLAMVFGRA